MSSVEIILKHPEHGERKLLKDGSAFSLQTGDGTYLIDKVYESELTTQAQLNFFLLYFKEKGFIRV